MQAEFVPFTEDFDYDKEFYDVQFPSGELVMHCWPNAGKMNGTGDIQGSWGPNDNIKVRLSDIEVDGHPRQKVVVLGTGHQDQQFRESIIKAVHEAGKPQPLIVVDTDKREIRRSDTVLVVDDEPDLSVIERTARYGDRYHSGGKSNMVASMLAAASVLGGGWPLPFGRRAPDYHTPRHLLTPELESANAKIAKASENAGSIRYAKSQEKAARKAARKSQAR